MGLGVAGRRHRLDRHRHRRGQRRQWARWVGIVTAGVSAISFFPWIYYQPLWTILSVVLAVLVIYALAMYGGFAKSGSYRGY